MTVVKPTYFIDFLNQYNGQFGFQEFLSHQVADNTSQNDTASRVDVLTSVDFYFSFQFVFHENLVKNFLFEKSLTSFDKIL